MTDFQWGAIVQKLVSTHMPLTRHDLTQTAYAGLTESFYSHASYEA